MRLLGIDYGEKRIGVAIGDTDIGIASPLTVISYTRRKDAYATLSKIITDEKVQTVILGMPISLSGDGGEMTKRVRLFAKQLQEVVDVDVVFEDERVSSRVAESQQRAGATASRDALAAAAILDTYLQRVRHS